MLLSLRKGEGERAANEATTATELRERTRGIAEWVARLPSSVSWRAPLALVGLVLLGWLLPGIVFTTSGAGWGASSLLYSVGGLALAVMFYLRGGKFNGPDLALAWFGAASFGVVAMFSLMRSFDLAATVDSPFLIAGIAVLTAVLLIAMRRSKISGVEFAIYWFGIALMVFWAALPKLGASAAMGALARDVLGGNPYRAAGLVLAGFVFLSAMLILLWRRSKLRKQEAALYGFGSAYFLIVSLVAFLSQAPA